MALSSATQRSEERHRTAESNAALHLDGVKVSPHPPIFDVLGTGAGVLDTVGRVLNTDGGVLDTDGGVIHTGGGVLDTDGGAMDTPLTTTLILQARFQEKALLARLTKERHHAILDMQERADVFRKAQIVERDEKHSGQMLGFQAGRAALQRSPSSPLIQPIFGPQALLPTRLTGWGRVGSRK